MLTDQCIVYFANDWGADNRTSAHHLARFLGRSNQMLYVEASGMRTPDGSGHDLKRVFQKVFRFLKGPQPVSDRIRVVSPLLIPIHGRPMIEKLNRQILKWSLRFWLWRLGFRKPILWIVIPHMQVLLGQLKEQLSVFYCVDKFSAMPGVNRQVIEAYDQKLTRQADVVFAVSEVVAREKDEFRDDIVRSPHGVDYDHFRTALAPQERPTALPTGERPILGYVGLLAEWIDFELLGKLADAFPECDLVLIGRATLELPELEARDNVYLLGQRPYESLPQFGHFFDVALIPYLLNEQVHYANPIKLREYLAMGRRVVSVRTIEIEKYSDRVLIADGHDEYIAGVRTMLEAPAEPGESERLSQSMEGESWESRLTQVSNRVQAALDKAS